jgi:hypothetical protein
VGEFGLPADVAAWCALAGAALWLVVFAWQRSWDRCVAVCQRHYAVARVILCACAGLGSLAYLAYYLRGGPRIIDAAAYWQQAKVLASGHLTGSLFEPSAATRSRFLYFDPDRAALSVLFPPGYAAFLALGFRLGAPLCIGPVLAALLVWATTAVARRLFQRNDVALLAGLLSVTTVALRYHTADTMSHGLAALLVAMAVYGCLGNRLSDAAIAGSCIGWLLTTRPVTGVAVLCVCLCYRLLYARRPAWLVICALWLVPGCALWFTYQSASTGSMWHATQLAYYAVADGPPGCFRYGFGQGIGCLFEHGDYVAKRLPQGYGLLEAAYVTLLRLRWHCLDVHNFELLSVATVIAASKATKQRDSRLLVVVISCVVLGYLPFYFDASYPGGGARLFVDIIPLEHVLVAGWLATTRWVRWFLPLSLAGFALHGSFEHGKLRDRDGGRPMFEPRVVREAGVDSGLIFVDSDHGFLLGHDPHAKDAKRGLVVLRQHGDANDRIAWQQLGRPRAYRYAFDPTAVHATPGLYPIAPGDLSGLERFEAESAWPVLAVASGWVRPVYPPNDCSSKQRGLSLEPIAGKAVARLSLFAERSGSQRLQLGLVARTAGTQRVALTIGQLSYFVQRDAREHQCFTIVIENVALQIGEQSMTVETGPLGVVLDYWAVG